MKTVRIRDAKAGFSALIADAERGQPTLITRHNQPTAMIVPVRAGQQLYPLEKPSLVSWLLALPDTLDTERGTTPLRAAEL